MKKQRQSGFELLRIIAMILIITIHALGLVTELHVNNMGRQFTVIMNAICNVGVSCFILLSGYFGIKADYKKLLRLELMVVFFSLGLVAVQYYLYPEVMCGSDLLEALVKSIIPVASRKYWFYSCYVCLFLLAPLIEEIFDRVEKRTISISLGTGLLLFSILPSLLYFEIMLDNGKGLINMILLYMIGRWIHRYADRSIKTGTALVFLVLLVTVNVLSIRYPIMLGGIRHNLSKDNSITNILIAVLLLYFFKNVKIQSRLVNEIARHNFAVFALNAVVIKIAHDFMIGMDQGKVGSNLFPLWILAEVIITYAICVVLDMLRELLLGWIENIIIMLVCKLGTVGERMWVRSRIGIKINTFFMDN